MLKRPIRVGKKKLQRCDTVNKYPLVPSCFAQRLPSLAMLETVKSPFPFFIPVEKNSEVFLVFDHFRRHLKHLDCCLNPEGGRFI